MKFLNLAVLGLIVGLLTPESGFSQPPPAPVPGPVVTWVTIKPHTKTIQPNGEWKYEFDVEFSLAQPDTFVSSSVTATKLPNPNQPLQSRLAMEVFSGMGGPPAPGAQPIKVKYHFFGPNTHKYEVIAKLRHTVPGNPQTLEKKDEQNMQ